MEKTYNSFYDSATKTSANLINKCGKNWSKRICNYTKFKPDSTFYSRAKYMHMA